MQQIDFLPEHYRQRNKSRKKNVWQIVVLAMFAGSIITASIYQYTMGLHTRMELGRLGTQRQRAEEAQQELAKLQQELAGEKQSALLVAYLKHAWPRTQLLDALHDPRDEALTFTELQISRQQARGATLRNEREATPAAPAAQDLQRLRQRWDNLPVVIQLSGVTSDLAALHSYVGRLNRSPLLREAQLGSVESDDEDQHPGKVHFEIRMTVTPGYGQPGGPQELAGNTTQRTDS